MSSSSTASAPILAAMDAISSVLRVGARHASVRCRRLYVTGPRSCLLRCGSCCRARAVTRRSVHGQHAGAAELARRRERDAAHQYSQVIPHGRLPGDWRSAPRSVRARHVRVREGCASPPRAPVASKSLADVRPCEGLARRRGEGCPPGARGTPKSCWGKKRLSARFRYQAAFEEQYSLFGK